MNFTNITKGEWVEDTDDTGIVLLNSPESEFIAQCRVHWSNSTENAKFICYCGNLQQKYDIGLFEETVRLLDYLVENNMCSVMGDDAISELLTKIKQNK